MGNVAASEREPAGADSVARTAQVGEAGATGASADAVLALQRMVGNQATVAMLQARRTVGPADDPLEREADRVAADVVRRLRDGGEVARRPSTSLADPTVRRKFTGPFAGVNYFRLREQLPPGQDMTPSQYEAMRDSDTEYGTLEAILAELPPPARARPEERGPRSGPPGRLATGGAGGPAEPTKVPGGGARERQMDDLRAAMAAKRPEGPAEPAPGGERGARERELAAVRAARAAAMDGPRADEPAPAKSSEREARDREAAAIAGQRAAQAPGTEGGSYVLFRTDDRSPREMATRFAEGFAARTPHAPVAYAQSWFSSVEGADDHMTTWVQTHPAGQPIVSTGIADAGLGVGKKWVYKIHVPTALHMVAATPAILGCPLGGPAVRTQLWVNGATLAGSSIVVLHQGYGNNELAFLTAIPQGCIVGFKLATAAVYTPFTPANPDTMPE